VNFVGWVLWFSTMDGTNNPKYNSEVRHPRCALKTNGKVNSVRKHKYVC